MEINEVFLTQIIVSPFFVVLFTTTLISILEANGYMLGVGTAETPVSLEQQNCEKVRLKRRDSPCC